MLGSTMEHIMRNIACGVMMLILLINENIATKSMDDNVAEGILFFIRQADTHDQDGENYPKDCTEVFNQCKESIDGVYWIKPDDAPTPFRVFCNNSVDGGGWTVFQRRLDGAVDFYRPWSEYKNGFGFLHREFWMGNDYLSYLTNQKDYELRIDLVSSENQQFFAKYNLFRISDEESGYRLVDLGDYDASSTTGADGMLPARNKSFSTLDRDNDQDVNRHCATVYRGGWWFNKCYMAFLNGPYYGSSWASISWQHLPGDDHNMKYSEMKIRPV